MNENKVHLNKSRTIEFAKNVCKLLLQQEDNSGNTALGSEKSSIVSGVSDSKPGPEKSQSGYFRNSGQKSVRGIKFLENQMKFH